MNRIQIVSGGQTGADRAALDWAIAHDLPHGGWCPRGRWAEDGPIADRYQLRETPESDVAQRTEWNVRDTDATVIFSIASELTGGSRLTWHLAQTHHKPCLHLHPENPSGNAGARLREFLAQHNVRVLNVAGPRASKAPGIAAFVCGTLSQALL